MNTLHRVLFAVARRWDFGRVSFLGGLRRERPLVFAPSAAQRGAASIHCLTLLVVAHENHAGLDQRAEAAWAGLQAGARAVASSTRRLPLF